MKQLHFESMIIALKRQHSCIFTLISQFAIAFLNCESVFSTQGSVPSMIDWTLGY